MRTGKSLTELAMEIERQGGAKRDYLADTVDGVEAVVAGEPGEGVELALHDNGRLPMMKLAHDQLAANLEIPRAYYQRMRAEQPELLAENVNTWLKAERKTRMVRTLDGKVRAWLSDRYRPLDNADFAEAVLPILGEMELQVLSAEITERRLYIKAVSLDITKDVPTGKAMGDDSHEFFDTVSPAIVLSNSEVGAGALSIETGVWTKVCTNLAIASQRSMRKYHVGGRHELGDEVAAMLSEGTKHKVDVATWAQVADVVRGAFERAKFDALVDDLAGAARDKIEGDPVKAVELGAKALGLGEGERSSVLQHLIRGGDLTRYGLHAAVTRASADVDDYDRATEMERAGWKVIELPRSDWQAIAQAA